jgi:poly(A) polymerase/tRNA nucleotidyltransferase (CCA-adding enzyme)
MEIPNYIENLIKELEKAGFEAFIVGGCVRDLLRGTEPKDWDITTNARPQEILKVFPDGKYENVFGTVLVPIKNKAGETLLRQGSGGQAEEKIIVEITTYRSEQGYSDRRHPDEIRFEDSLEKDLERRDFTVNAMAVAPTPSPSPAAAGEGGYRIIDLFGGQKDIKHKIIRAVGEPSDRFKEDALRMMRAIRFSCQLEFSIEPKTERAIGKFAGGIKFVSKERIKDELIKILESDLAYEGIILLHDTKLLQYILPELEKGIGVDQNRHHTYTVFKHLVLSLKYCPSKDWRVRFASLLHDIAKPQTKKLIEGDYTFYNHDLVGARVAKKIMQRLKFSNDDTEKVVNLIKHHMFYYNVDEVTASSVRRLIVKVGKENLKDLIDIRIADRLGSGVPKAKPYKLRHLEYMMEKVQKDPVSVKMLKINGDDLIKLLNIKPSPKIGAILDVLLSDVIEDPKLNNKKYLEDKSRELDKMDLEELRVKARGKIVEKKMEDDSELKKGFWVK